MKNQIFATGYRPLPPEDARARGPWAGWPIARTALLLAWRRTGTKIVLMLCASVVFAVGVALVVQVLAENAAQQLAEGQPIAASMMRGIIGEIQETFAVFLRVQFFFCAVALAVIAGGLIADDRHAGALELYFSRPLTPRAYALGKLLAAAAVPAITIVAPFVLLWLMAVGIAPPALRAQMYGLLLPGLGGALLATLVLSATVVGISAHGERRRTVGVIFVVLLLALSAVGEGVAEAGFALAGYLSPTRDLQTVVDSLLGVGVGGFAAQLLELRSGTVNDSAWLSAGALALMTLAGLGALAARLRQEVVG